MTVNYCCSDRRKGSLKDQKKLYGELYDLLNPSGARKVLTTFNVFETVAAWMQSHHVNTESVTERKCMSGETNMKSLLSLSSAVCRDWRCLQVEDPFDIEAGFCTSIP